MGRYRVVLEVCGRVEPCVGQRLLRFDEGSGLPDDWEVLEVERVWTAEEERDELKRAVREIIDSPDKVAKGKYLSVDLVEEILKKRGLVV